MATVRESDIMEFELGNYLERREVAISEEAIRAIDEEVWEKYGGYWSVMYTDLSGFSKAVHDKGLLYTLGIIHTFRSIALPIVEAFEGRLIKSEGDSLIVIFDKVACALKAAIQISEALNVYNAAHEGQQIFNACGIGYGRILKLGDYDLYGLEVNLASKLGEDIAKGSEILLTEAAKMQLELSETVSCEELLIDQSIGLNAFRLNKSSMK